MQNLDGYMIKQGSIPNDRLVNPSGGGSNTLSGLSDVDASAKATGRILQVRTDGKHQYVDLPSGGGSNTLSGLSDVDASAKATGRILQVRADGKHQYVDLPSGGGTATGFGISVKDYGAVGNGSADDTAAIQNAVNTAVTTRRRLYFPAGTYKITKQIDVPLGDSFVLQGESHGSVKIVQYANNVPILRFTKAYTSEWRISGISFTYNSVQPVTSTNAVPIYFDQPALDANGFWNFLIEWCQFSRGYYAIATNPAQSMAVWGVTIRHCVFESEISKGYVMFNPNPSVGQPNIQLENIYAWCGDTVAGPLVYITVADTVLFKSCEFNHVRCKPYFIGSCPNVTLINTRCEEMVFTVPSGSQYRFWDFSNSRATVIGCEITNITVNGGGDFLCLSANAAGQLNIIGFEIRVAALNNGSQCYAWDADTVNLVSQVSIVGAGRRQLGNRPYPRVDVDRSTPDSSAEIRDADVNLTVSNAQYQRVTTQTANRTVALPAAGGYDGLTFTVVKDNTAAFTLTVTAGAGNSAAIPAGKKGSVTYRNIGGTGWMPIQYSVFP